MQWRRAKLSKVVLAALLVLAVGVAAAAVATTPLTQNSDGAIINASSGPAVTLVGNTDVYPTTGGTTGEINWNTTDGNATFTSSDDTEVTISKDEITGPWTNVTSVDATNARLTINPEDKEIAEVEGGVTTLSYREAAGIGIDDGVPDFKYSAYAAGVLLMPETVTLYNLPASTTFRAATASGTDLGEVSPDSSGSEVIPLEPASNTDVYFFNNDAPTIDESSASPAPDAKLSDSELTLSVDVSDPEFASTQGDSVNVTFFVDGNEIDTKELTSNGTASTTTTISLGGSHTWHVEATDDYGGSDTSTTWSFSTPSTLFFRSEQDPDTLVNDSVVQVTAYYSGNIQRRNISDATLNLTGFPVDEPIVVRINATNYTTRTGVIESIYQQNSVYLLHQNISQNLVRFDLQQLTGDYPEEDTVLFVERDLKLNGSVQWRTIAGDNFGVKGVSTHLKADERYRIRIKNLETSQSAVIGSYTAIQPESVTVSAGSAQIEVQNTNKSYGWELTENETGNYILFEYEDTRNETESIKITVHERFNESNVLVDNATYTDTNELVYKIPMTANEANKTWTAELYIDRGNGYQHFRVPIGGGPTRLLPANIDEVWVQGIGVFVLLISGMAFSRLNQGVGAITTSLVGGILWYVGILSGGAVGVTVVAALGVAVVYHYRTGGGS